MWWGCGGKNQRIEGVGRWREESGLGSKRGQTKRDGEGKAGKMKVAAGFCGKDGSVREGEWHGWECE